MASAKKKKTVRKNTAKKKTAAVKKKTAGKKRTSKKKTAARKSPRRTSAKGPRSSGSSAGKSSSKKKIQGYQSTNAGVLVPVGTPIKPSKLKTGFSKAKKEIDGLADEMISSMNGDYEIKEIELSASFSADGKFLGIGVGGAATIKVKIAPAKSS